MRLIVSGDQWYVPNPTRPMLFLLIIQELVRRVSLDKIMSN